MNLADCIQRAIDAGDIDPERGARAIAEFNRRYEAYRQHMSDDAAQLKAGEDLQRMIESEATENRRAALLQIQAARNVSRQIAPHAGGGGGNALTPPGGGGGGGTGVGPHTGGPSRAGRPDINAMGQAALDTIEKLDGVGLVISAEQQRKRVLGQAHRIMTDVLATFRRDLLGRTREPARLENLVRELFGTATGDRAAKELAEAWSEAAEYLRKTFNQAGGHIPKLDRWGLPQAHDGLAVRMAAGDGPNLTADDHFRAWLDFVWPRLDRNRMTDWRTGAPMGDAELRAALREAWETIGSDGWVGRNPSRQARGRAISGRHIDPRFLHFKDGDAWLDYAGRFGKGDAFTAMLGHTAMMAREIGAMRALGPNPRATVRWLQDWLNKAANERGTQKDIDRARGYADALESAYDVYIGSTNDPAHGDVARAFQGVRNFLTSSMLGAAALSALTDLNFQRMAARFNGLEETRIFRRYVDLLDPTDDGDRRAATRLSLIAEEWSRIAAAQARYAGETAGPEWSQRLADFTLRVSGLSPWTQAGRWAFGMEFLGLLGDNARMRFGDLDPALRSTMQRYGIDEAAWDLARSTSLYRHRGADFLRPDDIVGRAGVDPDLAESVATRLLAMVQTETEYAVPSASIRARAFLGGRVKPGTAPGEILRSTLMFKNFAVTLAATHLRRALGEARQGRLSYTANLIIGGTVLGALSMTLKDVAKGRDPRDMMEHPAAFWAAALLQGGGLGIFGDFLFQDQNRFGGGITTTIAGPVFGAAGDVLKLTVGNVQQLGEQKDTNFQGELVRFGSRYMGPLSSIWYSRTATERLIFNQLERLVDPKFDKRVRRLEQRLERENGQGFWWRPGDILPGDEPMRRRLRAN